MASAPITTSVAHCCSSNISTKCKISSPNHIPFLSLSPAASFRALATSSGPTFLPRFSDSAPAAPVLVDEPVAEPARVADVPREELEHDEIFAVVMIGSRQYIVIPGRYIYIQRLKDAKMNDKGLNEKVVVFKYKKKKKNYRRNIGHRQPNTRIRIKSITGYEDFEATPNVES